MYIYFLAIKFYQPKAITSQYGNELGRLDQMGCWVQGVHFSVRTAKAWGTGSMPGGVSMRRLGTPFTRVCECQVGSYEIFSGLIPTQDSSHK